RHLRTTLPLVAMMVLIIGYMGTRVTSQSTGEYLVNFVERVIDSDRAESLASRFHNENLLAERALERPVFGWGGWNRSRVYNEEGEDISTTDGLWIIVLGKTGFFGLSALTLTLLVPAVALICIVPAQRWKEPHIATV